MPSHGRHHFIPDAFLSAWERPPEPLKLTRFVRRNGEVRDKRRSAKSSARVFGLYALHLVPPEQRNALEVGPFQRIDDEAAVVHRALLARPKDELSAEQGHIWIRFVASLLLRTPRFLRHWKGQAPETLNKIAAADDSGDGLREFFYRYMEAAGDRLPSDVTMEAIAQLLEESSAHHALAGAHWALRDVSLAKVDLVIGDEPVLRGGLLTEDYFFALPISPTVLFYASNSDTARARLEAMWDSEIVFLANLDSATQADEYLFATGLQHSRLARQRLGRGMRGHSRLARAVGIVVD
jgi:hypothetical protein